MKTVNYHGGNSHSSSNCRDGFKRTLSSGFSLIELLVVIALISAIAAMMLPALASAKARAGSVHCLNQLRQIGLATTMYADDNSGYLPRSTHSALGYGQLPWGYALVAYLRPHSFTYPDAAWTNLFNTLYRCSRDPRRDGSWSYGKNVFPELSAVEAGGPVWARADQMPRPSVTILYAEKTGSSMADHLMAHFWPAGAQPEVDRRRHVNRSNYVYCDGHVALRRFDETYDPSKQINNWNPATAR